MVTRAINPLGDTTRTLEALADIETGLREAEKGNFATDAQIATMIAKYTKRGHHKVRIAKRQQESGSQ